MDIWLALMQQDSHQHGQNPINISLQLASAGYKALDKVHNNMDKIRLQTLEIPKSLEYAVTILFKVQ